MGENPNTRQCSGGFDYTFNQVILKIKILVQNKYFLQKKNKIFVENRNFGLKSQFWPKIEILVQNFENVD